VWRHNGHRDEAEKFLKAIAANPGDGLHRHIFADWLEENGYDNASKGQRWAAANGKYAHPVSGWFASSPGQEDDAHLLPRHMFHASGPASPGVLLHRQGVGGTPLYEDPEPEHAFLQASNNLDWHPETGEPMERKNP
jgi:uncharacterized protein (TIGR02996 family)